MQKIVAAASLAALPLVLPPLPALAADPEVEELKRMLVEMKHEYESRINELESRIAVMERTTDTSETAPSSAPPPATREEATVAQTAQRNKPVAQPTSRKTGDSAFNPAISLVLQGAATSYSNDPEDWFIPGFQTGGEAGLRAEGLSITESELTASANVDHLFYGQATIGLHEETGGGTEIDLEEAFIDTLSLPAGLGLRFGRFYPEVGYLNTRHTHVWDWADAPLPLNAFLGNQYNDDGLRLSWIAPTDHFLELGVEALRGESFPSGGDGSDFLGDARNYFARIGADIGDSQSFRLGLSHLRAQPLDRSGDHAHGDAGDEHGDESLGFSGDSNLTVLDATWKWAPEGNFRDRNLTLRGEYFYREEDGAYTLSSDAGSALMPFDGTQEGFYLDGIYQFHPRWRAGVRYERLWTDNTLTVTSNETGEADDELVEETGLVSDEEPDRWSAMVDWSPSEFSRLRLQYTRDNTLPESDDQFFLQYIMSIGAHGAHAY
ncbi:MAG: hypothetical protein ABFS23_07005 [Pseudomonadota bacterium]